MSGSVHPKTQALWDFRRSAESDEPPPRRRRVADASPGHRGTINGGAPPVGVLDTIRLLTGDLRRLDWHRHPDGPHEGFSAINFLFADVTARQVAALEDELAEARTELARLRLVKQVFQDWHREAKRLASIQPGLR